MHHVRAALAGWRILGQSFAALATLSCIDLQMAVLSATHLQSSHGPRVPARVCRWVKLQIPLGQLALGQLAQRAGQGG
eukprot:5394339-Amphidinium_carterae.1